MISLREFDIKKIKKPSSYTVIGKRATGKSKLIMVVSFEVQYLLTSSERHPAGYPKQSFVEISSQFS